MKLIFHEWLAQSRRLWPFALCFLVMTAVDLSRVLDWNLDGTDSLDQVLEILRGLNAAFLFVFLFGSPLVLFAEISPIRAGSMTRVRPLSNLQAAAARGFWILLFVGLPWISHEFLNVIGSGFSLSLAILAAAQRVLFTLLWWIVAALVGWLTGAVWKTLAGWFLGLAPVIFLSTWLKNSLFSFFPETKDFGLQFAEGLAMPLTELILILALWLGFLRVGKRGYSFVRLWGPFWVAGLFFYLPYNLIHGAIAKRLNSLAENKAAMAEIRPLLDPKKSTRSLHGGARDQKSFLTLSWEFDPKEIPQDVVVFPFQGRGQLALGDAGTLDMKVAAGNFVGYGTNGPTTSGLRRFLGEVGENSVVLADPAHNAPLILTSELPRPGLLAEVLEKKIPIQGDLEARSNVYRFKKAHRFPADGSTSRIPGLGRVGVASTSISSGPPGVSDHEDLKTRNWIIRLQFQRPDILFRRDLIQGTGLVDCVGIPRSRRRTPTFFDAFLQPASVLFE